MFTVDEDQLTGKPFDLTDIVYCESLSLSLSLSVSHTLSLSHTQRLRFVKYKQHVRNVSSGLEG